VDKEIVFVLGPRTDATCRFYAIDIDESYKGGISTVEKSSVSWANYLLGVIDQLQKSGHRVRGFDCVFGGNIPIGAGMSSSAALEGGLAYALNVMFELDVERLDLVKLAQRAENEFVGVNCGIMDQFINIFGREKKVLKIDCRSLSYEYVPFGREDLRIVLCDTKVRRALASSEYNVRRAQCESGVAILRRHDLNARSLRDASPRLLDACRLEMDPVVYSRCSYVIGENIRVGRACDSLQRNDFDAFGREMYASHEGLRDLYQVSCGELDVLVDLAAGMPGVFGARMMGGGFGGCTINLVEAAAVEDFAKNIQEGYRKRQGIEPGIHICSVESGTSTIAAS
jgi:galactokinase